MVEKKCGERQLSLEPSSHKSTRYPISNLRVERGTHLFLTSSFIWPDRALYSREEREGGGGGRRRRGDGLSKARGALPDIPEINNYDSAHRHYALNIVEATSKT